MPRNLLIVESSSKAKSITTILNNSLLLKDEGSFNVIASGGHIEDLKKKELGIDIHDDWKPNYEILKDKKRVIKEIIKQVEKSDIIYLSSDADREGEAISESLRKILKLKDYKRITYNEVTSHALEYAIKNPRQINEKLVDAQYTRRALDRVVGFKLSPLLWQKYNSGNITLSAGRVQSVIVNIIINREKEISNFSGESYWHFWGNFILNIDGEIHHIEKVSLYKNKNIWKITSNSAVKNWLSSTTNQFYIKVLSEKLIVRNGENPFITSTLQQEAYIKCGFNLKKTMSLAQDLYEAGFITYHRTDSFIINDDFKECCKTFILSEWGNEYWCTDSLKIKKVKASQEAHECIRITMPKLKVLDDKFTPHHQKLYDMIWKKTIASLMSACIYDSLEMFIHNNNFENDLYFLGSIKKVKFNGWGVIYDIKNDQYNFNKIIDKGKGHTINCIDILAKNTFPSPPLRYNEGSIVKIMEKTGIGRPSSYSSIISKIIDKKYIVKNNKTGIIKLAKDYLWNGECGVVKDIENRAEIGKENGIFIPTEIGIEINNFLQNNFNYIVNCDFTSLMETDLDNIANGSKNYLDVLNTFWDKFGKDIHNIHYETDHKKKLTLKCSEKRINFNNIDYISKLAKYGPVIQYAVNNKTTYINLKQYLKYTKKEYLDIDENDIRFLTTLPKKIFDVNNIEVILINGIYGIYVKWGNKNISLPENIIIKLINEISITTEEMIEVIKDNSVKKPIPCKKNKSIN